MNKIVLKTAAKVNLYLKITSVRADGYHNLDTLMSSIDIYDRVTVSKRNDNFINCFMGAKLCDEKNTACKAAKLISTSFNTKGVDIFIKKNIPYSAGLGGSSADAAAVLYAMNELYGLGGKNLEQIALKIGSDVPFMLQGGSAQILGIGETIKKAAMPLLCNQRNYCQMPNAPHLSLEDNSLIIKKTPHNFDYQLLIIKGKCGLSTKSVYDKYDELPTPKSEVNPDNILSYSNDLQNAAISLCPEIENNIELLKGTGAIKTLMTGSGSAIFGIFDSAVNLEKAYQELKNKVYYCKKANFIKEGIIVINKV